MTPQHNSQRGLSAQCWLLAHLQALFSTSWRTWLDVVDDKTAIAGKERVASSKKKFSQLLTQKSLSPPPALSCNTSASDTAALKSILMIKVAEKKRGCKYFDPSFTRSRDLAGSSACQLGGQERQIVRRVEAAQCPNNCRPVQLIGSMKYS